MLRRALTLLVLALAQAGCDVDYRENLSPLNLDDVEVFRSRLERDKRSYLKIEDLQVGTGAVASWGRRLKAEIEVKYADNGKTI